MKVHCQNPFSVCWIAIFVSFWSFAGAQSIPSQDMIRAYMGQDKNVNSSQLQKALEEYWAQKKGETDTTGQIPEPGQTDLGMQQTQQATDSTAKKLEKPDQRLIYQNILNGKFPDPEKLIPTLDMFGYSIFEQSKLSSFGSSNKMSVPASYPISTDDEIIISLWGRMNEEYRLKVDRDGRIKIPHIGPVQVAGLPFSSMQQNILDKVQSIEGVQASISVGEMRAIQVYIVGEVRSPGQYTVSALTSVTNALFAAGGPTRQGSLRAVQLKRGGNQVATIDFYDFLMSGISRNDLRLKEGDVIFVPVVQKMAAIAGNVRRSALYELKGKTSLKDLIALAGGVTPAAWVNRIQIERFEENQVQTVLDLSAESAEKIPDFEIKDADIVKIFPIVVRDKNAIYLSGNIKRPGKYEFHDGMRISDVLPDYQTLQTETYFEYAVIKRQNPPSFVDAIMPFSLKSVLDNPSSADNLKLQPRDEIVIFHRDFFEPERIVSIDGAVNTPGNQKLLENMTVRDLIIQAGGLREDASPHKGELYRRVMEGENVKTQRLEFCVSCAMANDPQHNLALQRFDRVYVRKKVGWEEQKRVKLNGEFVFPGEYVLLDGETLGKLIQRAGGFAPEAYVDAAVMTRESVKRLEQKRIEEYAQQLEMDIMKLSGEMAQKENNTEAQALLNQQLSLLDKVRNVKPVGRVVIDLTHPGKYDNFMLEDGDSLFIPKEPSTVSVFGEVYNPATFQLDSRTTRAGYYVELAGGMKEYADGRNIYVVRANGSVHTRRMSNVKQYHLRPGDAVVVPQKIKYSNNFKTFIDTITGITNILTVAALIATITNSLR